jgi:hypothetical protein
MNAEFDSHEEAVRFHEGVAKLCRDTSPAGDSPSWGQRLLTVKQ